MHDHEEFLRYYRSVRRRTRALADAVPADRLEEAPPGRFTAGDIIRHIAATERWMWVENAFGRPSSYPGHGADLASGKDDVLEYMDRLHGESIELLSGLSDGQLAGKCTTVGGIDITVWKWLRLMVEHEVHHRGQLYEILGGWSVATPPLYGLTEPEVRERSEGS